MVDEKARKPTTIQRVTFSLATVERLETLAVKGTHGCNLNEVVRTFVEEGLRQAIKDRFLTLGD